MLYSRKLTEPCKPAIMEKKTKYIYIYIHTYIMIFILSCISNFLKVTSSEED